MGKTKSSEPVRLNKYIADSGVASRRRADGLIRSGDVKVNGKAVTELGLKVFPGDDSVSVGGKLIRPEIQKVYYMFNKPKNVLTSMSDPEGRPTVAEFFGKTRHRIFPVGRLDWETEGLLLMTNDGDFANEVMSPKKHIPKTYMAKVSGQPTDHQLAKLLAGVSIVGGGKVKALAIERIRSKKSDKYDWVKIIIDEGKNRQIRKMFEKIGFDVKKLRRVAIGQLRMGKLERGAFVELNDRQLNKIFAEHQGPLAEKLKASSTVKGLAKKPHKKPLRKDKVSAKRNPKRLSKEELFKSK